MKQKSTLIFLLVSIFTTYSTLAQIVGKQFPEMITETVDDDVITLPKDKQDKFTLVGLAYSKKSEADLNTWFDPVYHKFIKKGGNDIFSSFTYDVNVFFIPMFTGVNGAATGTAKKKAAQKMDSRLLPHILFYKGKLKPYKESLSMGKKDVPYFFVIDQSGEIVYATTGKFSDDKLDEIEELLDE